MPVTCYFSAKTIKKLIFYSILHIYTTCHYCFIAGIQYITMRNQTLEFRKNNFLTKSIFHSWLTFGKPRRDGHGKAF